MKKLCFGLLFIPSLIFCMSTTFQAQKRLLAAFSRLQTIQIPGSITNEAARVAAMDQKNINIPFELASQKWCNELEGMYQTLKTPLNKRQPLYVFGNCLTPTSADHIAFALPNGIYINHAIFREYPVGAIRSILGHEAVRVHNRDCVIKYLLNKATNTEKRESNSALQSFIYKTIRDKNISLEQLTLSYKVWAKHRADFSGHLLTQCSLCVLENAQQRTLLLIQDKEENLKKQGYLSPNQLKVLAGMLKDAQCVCEHHKNNFQHIH